VEWQRRSEQAPDGFMISTQVEQSGDLVAEGNLRARPHVDEVAAERITDHIEPAAGRPAEAQHRQHERERCDQQEQAIARIVGAHWQIQALAAQKPQAPAD
jgi:hypothetical protein